MATYRREQRCLARSNKIRQVLKIIFSLKIGDDSRFHDERLYGELNDKTIEFKQRLLKASWRGSSTNGVGRGVITKTSVLSLSTIDL